MMMPATIPPMRVVSARPLWDDAAVTPGGRPPVYEAVEVLEEELDVVEVVDCAAVVETPGDDAAPVDPATAVDAAPVVVRSPGSGAVYLNNQFTSVQAPHQLRQNPSRYVSQISNNMSLRRLSQWRSS